MRQSARRRGLLRGRRRRVRRDGSYRSDAEARRRSPPARYAGASSTAWSACPLGRHPHAHARRGDRGLHRRRRHDPHRCSSAAAACPMAPPVWIPGRAAVRAGATTSSCASSAPPAATAPCRWVFSVFSGVGDAVAGTAADAIGGTAVVGGRGVSGMEAPRGLEEFRRVAATVTGVARSRRVDRRAGGRGGGGCDARRSRRGAVHPAR